MSRKSFITLFCILLISASVSAQQPSLRISGDATMLLLGQRISQMYSRHRPARVSVEYSRENDGVDIFQSEHKSPQKNAIEVPIGIEAAVIYVNPKNPVSDLSMGEVRAIFSGEITNWKQVGGPDRQIVLYAGESSTSILPFFQETVLHGQEPYPFEGKATSLALVKAVAQNADAIGYTSLMLNPGVKAIRIRTGSVGMSIDPSADNIRSGRYPLSRFVYWYVSRTASEETQTFTDFALGTEGQLVVESVGYQPLTPSQRQTAHDRLQRMSSASHSR